MLWASGICCERVGYAVRDLLYGVITDSWFLIPFDSRNGGRELKLKTQLSLYLVKDIWDQAFLLCVIFCVVVLKTLLLNYIIYLHSKCCLWGGTSTLTYSPTNSHLSHIYISLPWDVKSLQDWVHPLPLRPDKAVLYYICDWSHGTAMYAIGWWLIFWELWGLYVLVDTVGLPMRLPFASAP